MPEIDLDDLQMLHGADPAGMFAHVAALSEQCRGAWALTDRLELPAPYRNAQNVLIAGMGGSAIGGDLVAAVAAESSAVPIVVQRDYQLPAWADCHTLVIASSHSGNTEETLSVFQSARERGCLSVALTTGGDLARLAADWGLPLVSFRYDSMPRAALGYLFVALLGILRAAGLVRHLEPDLDEALLLLDGQGPMWAPDSPRSQNQAKQLATALFGHVPVAVAAEALVPVARRWKTQLNENSKAWAYFEPIPEMNHNALSGIHYPVEAAHWLQVCFLRPEGLHPRNQLRLDLTQQIFESQGIVCHPVEIAGRSTLAQVLAAVHLGDHVSSYLACLYGTDPTAIEDIHGLKRRMSGRV